MNVEVSHQASHRSHTPFARTLAEAVHCDGFSVTFLGESSNLQTRSSSIGSKRWRAVSSMLHGRRVV